MQKKKKRNQIKVKKKKEKLVNWKWFFRATCQVPQSSKHSVQCWVEV